MTTSSLYNSTTGGVLNVQSIKRTVKSAIKDYIDIVSTVLSNLVQAVLLCDSMLVVCVCVCMCVCVLCVCGGGGGV